MAVHSHTPFNLGETLEITLDLPSGKTVLAQGGVVWDDRHGKTGIHFTCNHDMQQLLDSWLDVRFAHSMA
jgi:hypothetical protein